MVRVVLVTFPEPDGAAEVIRILVREKLAACGTILPGARSIYMWQETLEDVAEAVVLLKTTPEAAAMLETRLKDLHPYETPEIIALNPASVSADYARWVEEWIGSDG